MKSKVIGLIAILTISMSPLASADKTVLAGGCFWCMESDFEKVPGVQDVISGFTGGTAPSPTYNGDHTGHYEAVEITYDPAVVSYEDLLRHYWVNVDPFDDRGQFCDKGHSYLSAIFVSNSTERNLAEATSQQVMALFPDQKIVTPILDSSRFYPIMGDESYHQDYYKNNPGRYKLYRWSCGRDARLAEIWGELASRSLPDS
ncbi:MAG: peptide-methionine (S)-S-oxide reductase [Planctomycetaceae bacterium]|jgi:peptide-methionine (S)-S-oxide reductase